MNDINSLTGYEFEELICNLLRKIGFSVEHTSLSGDGGIDIIAYSEEIFFKGKYLVQCKRYSTKVGVPCIRDLYGVVLSERANKGILITNSDFTKQAIDFCDGKNIELINGDNLIKLLHQYGFENQDTFHIDVISNFTQKPNFDFDRYTYLKKWKLDNKKEFEPHLQFFRFLYSYILSENADIVFSGLLKECIQLVEEIVKRFGKKKHRNMERQSNGNLCKFFFISIF